MEMYRSETRVALDVLHDVPDKWWQNVKKNRIIFGLTVGPFSAACILNPVHCFGNHSFVHLYSDYKIIQEDLTFPGLTSFPLIFE
jgi:hypothetical protein